MIKNVILDIGNVLVDFKWEEVEREIIQDYAQKIGLADEEEKEALFGRLRDATVNNPTWNEYDIGNWTEEEVIQSFVDADPELEEPIRQVGKSLGKMLGRREASIPWIDRLHEMGYQVCYLSNYSAPAVRDSKTALDFLPHTDGGFLSYTVHMIKPSKAYYQLLLEEYELEASESVFIDDMERNVEGAKAAGIHAIRFESIPQAMEELERISASAVTASAV
ncbi:MAG: HAD family phosphatase [Lachnospiraceae bacterium]|nr:HAD family phosphatase [Lachnospiraceae bacterium]